MPFFRIKKSLAGKPTLYNPNGQRFWSMGVCSIDHRENGQPTDDAFEKKFKTREQWRIDTRVLLTAHHVNTAAAWSEDLGMPYTPILSMLTTFPPVQHFEKNDVMVLSGVFEPEFQDHVSKVIRDFGKQDDPNLIGYFTDNELPLSDPAHIWSTFINRDVHAAVAWKQVRANNSAGFYRFLMETYFEKVFQGIKAADPNHLILGTRINDFGTPKAYFLAAKNRVDVLSVNYYHQQRKVNNTLVGKWSSWAGDVGIIISEFYAKARKGLLDLPPGATMPNRSGAGIKVETQADRAAYARQFLKSCFASDVVVGAHWFKYMDGDPTIADSRSAGKNASNRGIVGRLFSPYDDLLGAFKSTV